MFDMSKMMEKFKDLQEQMRSAQEEVGRLTASGEAGAGMVKVTVNGKRQLIKLEIDPEIVSKEDQEMMQDLIVAATNSALAEVEALIQREMQKRTQGLLPNIPGMNFGNFGA